MKPVFAALTVSITLACTKSEAPKAPATPPTPAPLVGPQRTERREAVISTIKAKREGVLLCVGNPAEQEFNAIELTIEVGEQGEVIRAEAARTRNDAVAQCMVKELKTLTFPAGRRAVVTVPLSLLNVDE